MNASSNRATHVDVTSPCDGSLIKTLPLQTAADVERMLRTSQRLFKDRTQWLGADRRMAILNKLADLVAREDEEFALLIAREGGKPLCDARVEVSRAVAGIRLAAEEIPCVLRGQQIPMGLTAETQNRVAFTLYEPIGQVVAISAFNHPLNLIVHQVVPAVAVGCPVIVKPALTTPLNCLRFCELLDEAGLPPGWCQPIICDDQVAEGLVTDARVAFLSFIGSARVGWMLRGKLPPGARCALEHGGAAPVIIDEDIAFDEVIPALLKGGFYHSGQVCVSVQRVFVPHSRAGAFAEELARQAARLKVGPATDENTELGPMIRPEEVERVDAWVHEAVAQGASLLTGGKKIGRTSYAPTVLYNPPPTAKVSTQEIFGPVVCVHAYEDVADALAQANSLDYAFQAAVFSHNLDWAVDMVGRLDATAVMVNDHSAFRADWMPFAGRRHSGYGVGGIGYTMRDLSQIKMAVIKTTPGLKDKG